MADRIGPHTFAYILGEVPAQRLETEVITKPGEDGFIRRRIGVRSDPFDLKTQGAYNTEVAARNAFQIFVDMIGNDADEGNVAYLLEKDDVNYTTDLNSNYRVVVQNVRLDSLQLKACIAGTSNRWWMECTWTLLLVPV